jgi:hypothetical protein
MPIAIAAVVTLRVMALTLTSLLDCRPRWARGLSYTT